jgi:RNA polymerase sigma-70 factor (ECF subfamily)
MRPESPHPLPSELYRERFLRNFLANQHRIYRYIASLVPQDCDAEDLFQQTCLTLWEKIDTYDPHQDFTRWACGIAHNHVRNYHRKSSRRPLFDDELLAQLADRRLSELSYYDQLSAALADCLNRLSPWQRQLIEQCYRSGATMKDVAGQRGCTPNVLYKQLRQLRGLLHDCMIRRVTWEGLS